jgi:hypothetical protein
MLVLGVCIACRAVMEEDQVGFATTIALSRDARRRSGVLGTGRLQRLRYDQQARHSPGHEMLSVTLNTSMSDDFDADSKKDTNVGSSSSTTTTYSGS